MVEGLPAFLLAAIALAGSPGPATLSLTATGAAFGARRGAAYLAGMALGVWADEDEVAEAWSPKLVIEPQATDARRRSTRTRWLAARERSLGSIPELSGLDF